MLSLMTSSFHTTNESAIGGQYSGGFDSGKKSGPGSNYVMRPDDQWELYTGEYVKGARTTGSFNTSAGFLYTGKSKFNANHRFRMKQIIHQGRPFSFVFMINVHEKCRRLIR